MDQTTEQNAWLTSIGSDFFVSQIFTSVFIYNRGLTDVMVWCDVGGRGHGCGVM